MKLVGLELLLGNIFEIQVIVESTNEIMKK